MTRVYAAAIFLSAFLLFQIEPIIAKYILPWFGGTASVWTTCLLFFQILLLAGYAYAHLIDRKLTPRAQAVIHLAVIALCLVMIVSSAVIGRSPILPGAMWKPIRDENPWLRILLMLTASIGVPFFTLSATTPLLQAWYPRVHREGSPYRLYSLSNFGSLIALVTYPFMVEPNLRLWLQATIWSWLYVAFAIGIAACAIPILRGHAAPVTAEERLVPKPTRGTLAMWVALPACASLLLYSGTAHLTQDTAPIPFLWVLPLSLYLLSFVICFDNERWYRRGIFHPLFGAAVAASFLLIIYTPKIASSVGHLVLTPMQIDLLVSISNVLVLIFSGFMICHGELVRLRPHQRDLTTFYLLVSAGGALGGLLSAVVAPIVFHGFWDYRFAVWTCAALLVVALWRDHESWMYRRGEATGIAILAIALAFPLVISIVIHASIYAVAIAVIVLTAVIVAYGGRRPAILSRPGIMIQLSMATMLIVLAFVFLRAIQVAMHNTLWMARNFYGAFRIVGEQAPDHAWKSFALMNGRIEHGRQYYSDSSPQMRYYPATYYGTDSGVGLVIMNHPKRSHSTDSPLRVGVVGLGVGSISAWGQAGDYFRFYEINPEIIKVATNPSGYFSYLHDSSAQVVIVPGDARLSMERELAEGHPQNFDVLVIDAFNGDSIPTHLLTREALYLYLAELSQDGVLAVHISNLYLNLAPVLAEHSRAFNLRFGFLHLTDMDLLTWASDWVLMARNDKIIGQPQIAGRMQGLEHMRRVRQWTDDYSNVYQVLK